MVTCRSHEVAATKLDLVDAGRFDKTAKVLGRRDLELRSLEKHAKRMLDECAHLGDPAHVIHGGVDNVLGMGKDDPVDAATFGLFEH